MCGACGHVPPDERVAGPRGRDAAARVVSELTGLRVVVATGVWTVSMPTGRQLVCTTLDDLIADASTLSGVPGETLEGAVLQASAAGPG